MRSQITLPRYSHRSGGESEEMGRAVMNQRVRHNAIVEQGGLFRLAGVSAAGCAG